jgi:hypothetical protein
MAWSPSYNGFALTKANGIALTDWSDSGPVKVSMADLLIGGSAPSSLAIVGRVIEAKLMLSAATTGAFEALLSDLLTELHQTSANSLKLDSTREIAAYSLPGKFKPTSGGGGVSGEIAVKWVSEDPYWSGTSAATVSSALTSPTALNITNSGDAPAAINFQVENTSGGDFTGVTATVKNTTTGEEFRIHDFDIDAGDTLRLDEDGQIYFDDPIGAGSKTPVRVDGKIFALAAGANAVTVTHGMGTSGTWTIAAFPRHHYHGAFV